MCRKNQLQGCCCLCFGLGVMIGHSLESWMISSFGGLVLLFLGVVCLRRR